YVDIDSSELWESLPEDQASTLCDAFHMAVHKLYPGLEDKCKWGISDMDQLIAKQLCIGVFDANNLGMYCKSGPTDSQHYDKLIYLCHHYTLPQCQHSHAHR
ncbi:hypothetical protein L208DRAFT_1280367, partial [Tricholoma matsutake]